MKGNQIMDANTNREKLKNMILSGKTYFYIDYAYGTWYVDAANAPQFMISDEYNPVEAIQKSGAVYDDDITLFESFAQNVSSGRLGANVNSICFRVKSDASEPTWYRLNVRIADAFMAVGDIDKMTEREIMDHNILDYYTNDRQPKIYAGIIEKRLEEDVENDYAFIQFDIKNFKLINDKYGEPVGTELLNYINDTLRIYCTDRQIYSRLSSDIFMVVTPYSSPDEIEHFIRGLEKRMSGYKGIKYDFAFGVYYVFDRKLSSRIMGDSAGIARSVVKGNVLENIGYYNDSLKTSLKHRKEIEDSMYPALKNGEFVMYLQAKYSISDNMIIGAEALVRWDHPTKGLIPPGDFIPVFERDGFIIKLDYYIWECACKQLRKWLDLGYEPVPISVNVSRLHLKSSEFIDSIEGLIEKYDIPKHLLELEITETIENINANEMVQEAKNHGFTLLMDDFGSGYSSLNTLKSTPFDVLKIDRSFLSSFMESDRGQKIISHTISMSQDIGLDLIAEGVETKEQAEFLYGCGCNAAQGFYYSKPVPVRDFEHLMSNQYSAI